jgi:predicted XRE-type DNA-binding protein
MSDEHPWLTMDGNDLFAELGFADAEELKAKSDLIIRIHRIMRERGLNQRQLGEAIGMKPAEVSRMLRGHLDRFSIERLMRAMNALGVRVRVSFAEEPMAATPMTERG